MNVAFANLATTAPVVPVLIEAILDAGRTVAQVDGTRISFSM
jgi:hypothetical protein